MCSYYNTLFYRRTIGPWSFYKHKKAYELHSEINKYYCLILLLLEDVLKLLQVHSNILLKVFHSMNILLVKAAESLYWACISIRSIRGFFLIYFFICLKAVRLLALLGKTFTTTLKLTCWKSSENQDNH